MTSEQQTFDTSGEARSLELRDATTHIVDSEHKSAPEIEEGYPYVKTSDIENGRIHFEDVSYVGEESYEEWTRRLNPEPGDIVLTREAPVGRVGIVPEGKQICLGQRTVLIRPNPEILDNQFLRYLLLTDEVQNRFEALSTGSTVDHLNLSDLRSFELRDLPRLEDQKKIGTILSYFDEKIKTNQKINSLLEEVARSLFEYRFVDFEPYDSFKDSERGQIPDEFEVAGLTDITDVVLGGTPDSSEDSYWGGDIVWAKAKDVSNEQEAFISETEKNITEKGLEESSTEIAPKNSTIITARGTVGELAMPAFDMAINQSCYSLVSEREEDRYFVYFLMDAILNNLMSRTHGTVFDTITKRTLNEQDVVLPPEEDRAKFHDQVTATIEQIRENQIENRNLESLRDTLLPKLVSGEVRVNDISLDDLEVGSEV
ncbi:restriction endonuclease subunit S [Haloplanus halobius]|uniref:restriction endonuclease subunit S n=1 Tax=Haloplanus halobius TaxID=2934938 RepID=UPI00200FBAE8|nr:restriction endonuclease subunit S [Haloplanus sp. XH21]